MFKQITNVAELEGINDGIVYFPNKDFAKIFVNSKLLPDTREYWLGHIDKYSGQLAFRIIGGRAYGYCHIEFYLGDHEYNRLNFYMMNYANIKPQSFGFAYNKGDFVKVSKNLLAMCPYDTGCMAVPAMIEDGGVTHVITNRWFRSGGEDTQGDIRYRLDGNLYVWSPSMLDNVKLIGETKSVEIPNSINLTLEVI